MKTSTPIRTKNNKNFGSYIRPISSLIVTIISTRAVFFKKITSLTQILNQ